MIRSSLTRFGFVLISLLSFQALAQGTYYVDAFRYSQSQLVGSARTLGFAGAQTALGADLTSLSTNPAGLGYYRKSEYAISPNFVIPSTSSIANGSPAISDNKFVFNINNMGIAVCGLRDDIVESKWRGGTFALGLTRTMNFQNAFTYQGINEKSSLADQLTISANNGYNWNNYNPKNVNGILDLAYGTYVFSPYPVLDNDGKPVLDNKGNPTFYSDSYYNFIPGNPTPHFQQTESINEKGGTNEWSAGYGGNYNNVLFMGASLSLVTLRYDRIRNYQEYMINNLDQENIMTSIGMNDYLKVRGTGINLNLGVSVRAGDYVRTGLSFKTPSLIGMKETYNADMSATYAHIDQDVYAGQPNYATKTANTTINNYTYTSPFQASYGLAIFAGKYGFITGDVQYIDYSTARVSGGNGSTYISANQNIENVYKSAFNFKVGAEARIDIFYLRAGVAQFGSPWKDNVHEFDRRVRSGDSQSFTFGLGVRNNEFFLDMAFSRTTYNSNYSPYLMPSDTDDLKVKSHNVLSNFTIGGGVFF